MQKEEKGEIIELFDSINGIIKGEDQKEYYYSKIDFLDEFEPEIGQKVIFKKEQYDTNKEPIYKATYISKDEETNI